MRVVKIEAIPASIPYDRREVSAVVARDGVTDIIVKVTTDAGLVGWGESCSGADAASVCVAVEAMKPFVLGRDPMHRERIQRDLWHYGLWRFRPMTGSFAWAGIDMALWDVVGKHLGQPLHQLLGGSLRDSVSYFYYLSRGPADDLAAQCADGLVRGYNYFYIKVGLDPSEDRAMVAAVREALGPGPRLRLDANGAWNVSDALQYLRVLSEYDIDFVEQPVREHPLALMADVRARSGVAVAANEGLWTVADTLDRLVARVADVYCFSPYWVGSITAFQRLSWLADSLGAQVCKHTHGEFGIAAAAAQQVLLTLPSIVEGNQQTANHMQADVLSDDIPIRSGPHWPADARPGLGIEIDEERVADAAARYQRDGQFLPYQLGDLRSAWGVA
jgi:L-alanine-DL-glutamate epimerase-like enolase superfamily enzyme